MTEPAKQPAVSRRRTNFGHGAALALVALAVGVYFAPRAVPQSQVQALCGQKATQQLKTQGDFDVIRFTQDGYSARFNLIALGGLSTRHFLDGLKSLV